MINKKIKIKEIMLGLKEFPIINQNIILKEALEEMNKFKLGIVCIVNDNKKLIGVITDGDIRRKILKVQKPFSALLVDDALIHSNKEPIIIQDKNTLEECIEIMGNKQIWDLPVVDDQNELLGLLHLHPAIKQLLKN